MKKNLTKIMMMALCLCMMIAMFAVVVNAEDAAEKPAEKKEFNVELDKYYAFYNGLEHKAPVVIVTDEDGKPLDKDEYTVSWDYRANAKAEPNDEYKYYKDAGAYYVTVKGANDTAYEDCTKTSFFSILSTRGNSEYEFDNDKNFDSVYGEKVEYVLEGGYSSGAHKEIAMFREVNEDGTFGEYTTEVPTDAGTYQYYVIDFGYYYYLDATVEEFTIAPKEITVTLDNKTKVYGDAEVKLTWTDPKDAVLEGDDLGFVATRDEGEMVGTYAIDGKASNKNYKVNVVKGEYTITQRVVELDWDKVLTFNGETQTPNVWVKNLVGGDVCEVEIVGGARKYAGEYTVKVVALGNDNYKLVDGDAMIVDYKIVETADGEGDRDVVVDKFVDILGNIADKAEAAAPVVDAIANVGNAIWGGIKAGFKALVSDFFGRVFG